MRTELHIRKACALIPMLGAMDGGPEAQAGFINSAYGSTVSYWHDANEDGRLEFPAVWDGPRTFDRAWVYRYLLVRARPTGAQPAMDRYP